MPVVIESSALGRRVVVRFRRRPPAHSLETIATAPPFSDAVGELIAHDGRRLTVATRSGPVDIPVEDVVVAKLVAPDRARILALEAIASRGWQAAEEVELDGWLLRANAGWTSRANSVLPLRTPHRPIEELIAAAGAFYAERSLPLRIQVALPARGLLDAELAKRCWPMATEALVLSKPLSTPIAPVRADLTLAHEGEPSPDWRSGYHARDGQLPEAALGLLRRHPQVTFLSAWDEDRVVAIGRGTVEGDWLGVTALEVAEAARRSGAATALMAELERWGRDRGARQAYLQVEAANRGAQALYARLGYTEHHRYHYRQAP
jgi:GNAT superfamily N-acetyltransferase